MSRGSVAAVLIASLLLALGCSEDSGSGGAFASADFTSRTIGEMSVPAWLMPIQKTKLVMSHAQ